MMMAIVIIVVALLVMRDVMVVLDGLHHPVKTGVDVDGTAH